MVPGNESTCTFTARDSRLISPMRAASPRHALVPKVRFVTVGKFMIDVKTREKIFRRIDLMRDEMVDLQLRLTGIPALSPDYQGAGEAEKADFLESYLRKSGFDNILDRKSVV